jgi:hypothetical protein
VLKHERSTKKTTSPGEERQGAALIRNAGWTTQIASSETGARGEGKASGDLAIDAVNNESQWARKAERGCQP